MTAASTDCKKGFNYCFWAKLIVAIPALPLIAIAAASPFGDIVSQIIAAAVAIAATIWLAIQIDRMPCLLKKVVNKS